MKKILLLMSILFLVTSFLAAQDNEMPFYDFWESLDFREQQLITIGIQHGLMASSIFFEETIENTPPDLKIIGRNMGDLGIKEVLEYGQYFLSIFIFIQGKLMTPLEICARIEIFFINEENRDLPLSEIISTIFLNKGDKFLYPQKQE